MSKKFRLAFKRTLCRCCYTSEELLELNGKSKSIYCSDTTAVNSIRKNGNNITKLSFMDLNGTKNVNGFLNTDTWYYLKNGRRSHTCPCYQSHFSIFLDVWTSSTMTQIVFTSAIVKGSDQERRDLETRIPQTAVLLVFVNLNLIPLLKWSLYRLVVAQIY
jgi:hypothetical protein